MEQLIKTAEGILSSCLAVKEGEEVLQDNPLHRFGGRFWRGVDLASLDPFSNLGGGEARRSLSGGAGGLVQCRHRRASDFWEFGKQKPEAQGTWPIRLRSV